MAEDERCSRLVGRMQVNVRLPVGRLDRDHATASCQSGAGRRKAAMLVSYPTRRARLRALAVDGHRNGLPRTVTAYVREDTWGQVLHSRILASWGFCGDAGATGTRSRSSGTSCAARLDERSAFRPLRGGETLDGGVRAHPIGRPRRAEIPFELPSHRAPALGDTLLEVDRELRVWPRHLDGERRRTWYDQRFLRKLRPLTTLDVERVLVTHGEPVNIVSVGQ
jgi:hypothetical protein